MYKLEDYALEVTRELSKRNNSKVIIKFIKYLLKFSYLKMYYDEMITEDDKLELAKSVLVGTKYRVSIK
jgi:hypothetical protein